MYLLILNYSGPTKKFQRLLWISNLIIKSHVIMIVPLSATDDGELMAAMAKAGTAYPRIKLLKSASLASEVPKK